MFAFIVRSFIISEKWTFFDIYNKNGKYFECSRRFLNGYDILLHRRSNKVESFRNIQLNSF